VLTTIELAPSSDSVLICFRDDLLACRYWHCRAERADQLAEDDVENLDLVFLVVVQIPLAWQQPVFLIQATVLSLDESAPLVLDLVAWMPPSKKEVAVVTIWESGLLVSFAVELRENVREQAMSKLLYATDTKKYLRSVKCGFIETSEIPLPSDMGRDRSARRWG